MKLVSDHGAAFLLLVFCASAIRENVNQNEASPDSPPSDEKRHDEMFQCDRQCRWYYGYFSVHDEGTWSQSHPQRQRIAALNIVGKRVARPNARVIKEGKYCKCFQKVIEDGKETVKLISDVPLGRFTNKKPPTDTTWTGTDTNGFDTPFICVETSAGLKTMREDNFKEGMGIPLHCGVCSACSSVQDIKLLSRTRQWITEVMTKVSTKFAAPWGHKNATRLMDDLDKVGITFSRTRWDGRSDLPSCMEVWADNIMCDAMKCKDQCWSKFFTAGNTKTEITGDPKFWQLNAKCLKCDELNCGPAFIKGAGANRRSTGIESDIARPEWQKCKHGFYSGVEEQFLPTDPMPNTKKLL